ncbi:MAG TPA: L-histidine N(alpha)-methyltransferase [Verrucomicrobiae bacterium]|jgi:uncharacterized SAM-dependent methyltransferase|nr:L-histidine N(alpha)-methyltransferase [Verrucomicrobiae bacterium]
MPLAETVTIDASQFPAQVRADLLESLRTRRIQPKFHYDSYKQAQKWLALHEAHSPARTDPGCLAIYEQAFAAAAGRMSNSGARVIGLGCGGGQKEARLVEMLRARCLPVSHLLCDVSVPLVLTAQQAVERAAPGISGDALVCDLARCESLAQTVDRVAAPTGIPRRRIFTCFGMTPNFEPDVLLPRLAELVRAEDLLLVSANLAPGTDYAAGVRQVLGGYDNELTRDWLLTFLLDIGVEPTDGALQFQVEDTPGGFKRIAADFHFVRHREIEIFGERLAFAAGEKVRLFYSYRYTPLQVRVLAEKHRLKVVQEWVADSGEEGVFLCGQ